MAGFLGEAILASTIRRWASTECDPYPCGQEVWRYACELAGAPMPPLPAHGSRRAMRALLREHGGLEAYSRELILSLGWREVAEPGRGDVGVVRIKGMGLTCAISLGSMWMAKGPHHVLIVRAPHRAAWSLECLKQSLPSLSLPSR